MITLIYKTLGLFLLFGSFVTVQASALVDLEWRTKSETNNDFFTIERSTDGTSWEVIGTMPGSGTTSAEHNYTFTDFSAPEGIVYYSLKQTDIDGLSIVSKIISVDVVDESSSPTVILYPNPAFSYVVLKSNENLIITGMYSSDNKLICDYRIAYDIIVVHELQAGVYYIQYQTEQGDVKAIPFVKN